MPDLPNPQPNPSATKNANVAVMRQVIQAFNSGDTQVIDKVISPKIVQHSAHPIPANGDPIAALKNEILLPLKGFPDLNFKEELMIAEGDMVFFAWEWTGTNTGQLYGQKPTGKKLHLHGGEVARFSDGKVVEHWDQFTKPRLETLTELGILDGPMLERLDKAGLV
jgi:predicted ester cyclase